MLEISEIKICPFDEPKFKAVVRILFNDCLVVGGMKIIQSYQKGLILCMPQRKGIQKDVAHPVNKLFRKKLEKQIFSAYQQVVSIGGRLPKTLKFCSGNSTYPEITEVSVWIEKPKKSFLASVNIVLESAFGLKKIIIEQTRSGGLQLSMPIDQKTESEIFHPTKREFRQMLECIIFEEYHRKLSSGK